MNARRIYVIAGSVGVLLWLGTMTVSGRREAWDSDLYWIVAYPLCLVTAGVLGYLAPSRPWRWALAVMLVQPVLMVFTSGGSLGLLPIGLVLVGVLALPAMASARVGAWIGGR